MKILLNLLPVYTGGGLQNAVNFWKTCLKLDNKNQWFCLTRKGSEISKLNFDENHKIINVDISTNYLYRFYKDNKTINHFSKKYGIDVIFTLVGPGPLTKMYPKVNGWHEPAFVYPESLYWKRAGFVTKTLQKLKYIYASKVLNSTDFISVQTETMKARMIKYRNIPASKLFIVPNGITSFCETDFISEKKDAELKKLGNKIKLLVLSEPWLHKNFEYLIEVAKLLNDNYIFVVSFERSTNSVSNDFISKVNELKLGKRFCFIGRVQHSEIKSIYDKTDGVFLPTLLESFSANYVEAMYYNKPIFTSNLDFAKEVCQDYAFYFDPLDAKTGFEQLTKFYENGGYQNFKENTQTRTIDYPNWEKRFQLYLDIINKAKNRK